MGRKPICPHCHSDDCKWLEAWLASFLSSAFDEYTVWQPDIEVDRCSGTVTEYRMNWDDHHGEPGDTGGEMDWGTRAVAEADARRFRHARPTAMVRIGRRTHKIPDEEARRNG